MANPNATRQPGAWKKRVGRLAAVVAAAILVVHFAEEIIGAKQVAEGAIGLMQACRSTTAFELSLALGVVGFVLLSGSRLPLLRRLPSDKTRGFGGLAVLGAVVLAVVGITRQGSRPKVVASSSGPRPNRTVFSPPIGVAPKSVHHVSVTHHRHISTRPKTETAPHVVTPVDYHVAPVVTAPANPVATAASCGCENYTPAKPYESTPPEEPSREPAESSESESQESHDETNEESTSSSEISSHSYSSSPDGTAEANVDVSINASIQTSVDVSTSATS